MSRKNSRGSSAKRAVKGATESPSKGLESVGGPRGGTGPVTPPEDRTDGAEWLYEDNLAEVPSVLVGESLMESEPDRAMEVQSTDVDWRQATNGLIQDVLMDYLADPSGSRGANTVVSFLSAHNLGNEGVEAAVVDFFSVPRSIDDFASSREVSSFIRATVEGLVGMDEASDNASSKGSQDEDALGGTQGAESGSDGLVEAYPPFLDEGEGLEDGSLPEFEEKDEEVKFGQWSVVLPHDEEGVLRTGNDFLRHPPVLILMDESGENELASLLLNERTSFALLDALEKVADIYRDEEEEKFSLKVFWLGILDTYRRRKWLRYFTFALLGAMTILGVYGLALTSGWLKLGF